MVLAEMWLMPTAKNTKLIGGILARVPFSFLFQLLSLRSAIRRLFWLFPPSGDR